jgi:D-arabinose 1-dehydrogenase-like Zn-dependent alcohol dehydrogenase
VQISRTKAAILVEQHKPLVVAEVKLPEALSFGQVLVKVHYSGICGAQINEIEGAKGPDKFLPHLLGHEGSGTLAPKRRDSVRNAFLPMGWQEGQFRVGHYF